MTEAMHFRADGSMTPQALKKLEAMAADNKSQGSIASYFGIQRREFETKLARAKGNNPERLAWERGRSAVEQTLMDRLYKGAMGVVEEKYVDDEPMLMPNGLPALDATGKPMTERIKVRTIHLSKANTIEAIFFAKAQFGWKEGESEEKKVSNVTLVLPKPRSRAEYFAMMGVVDSNGPAPMKTVVETPLAALPAPAADMETIKARVRALTTPPGENQ